MAEAQVTFAQSDVDRLAEKLKAELESPSRDTAHVETLRRRLSSRAAETKQFHEARLKAMERYHSACHPAHKLIYARLLSLTDLQFSALAAIRLELGVEGDLGELRSQAKEHVEDMDVKIRKVLQNFGEIRTPPSGQELSTSTQTRVHTSVSVEG